MKAHSVIEFSPSKLFAQQRQQIMPAYALLVVENTLRVAQPFVLGWAINDLINRSSQGVIILIVQHLAYMLAGTLRQRYETRVINRLSAAAESSVLTDEQLPRAGSPWVKALAQVRESIGMLEHVVPLVMHVSFSMFGAMLMLGWYDITLVPLCLALLVPAFLLNAAYGRKSSLLSGRLQGEYKREAKLLAAGEQRDIRRHFEALAQWRIKLSDSETTNFCLMELFVLGVIATALVHYCLNRSPQAGDIFAVLQYVLLFIAGLRGVPFAVHPLSRPRAACRRFA